MKKYVYISSIALIFILTGCNKTMLVRDYTNNQLVFNELGTPNQSNLEKSIRNAAISLGWRTEIINQGEIRATLNVRTHKLVVTISYDNTSYSIKYVSSEDLLYDGEKIHKKYDMWVRNLIKAIDNYTSMY